jgi:hypothetical protein
MGIFTQNVKNFAQILKIFDNLNIIRRQLYIMAYDYVDLYKEHETALLTALNEYEKVVGKMERTAVLRRREESIFTSLRGLVLDLRIRAYYETHRRWRDERRKTMARICDERRATTLEYDGEGAIIRGGGCYA